MQVSKQVICENIQVFYDFVKIYVFFSIFLPIPFDQIHIWTCARCLSPSTGPQIISKLCLYADINTRVIYSSYSRNFLWGADIITLTGNVGTLTKNFFSCSRCQLGLFCPCCHLEPDFRHIIRKFFGGVTSINFQEKNVLCKKGANITRFDGIL